MRWLACLLLVGVFVRHDASHWLPWYSAPEWFYILGGLWECLLSASLLLFLRWPLAVAALWIGILEGAQVAACGALMGHARAPEGFNECDYLTGLPIGFLLTVMEFGVVCWAIKMSWRSASHS